MKNIYGRQIIRVVVIGADMLDAKLPWLVARIGCSTLMITLSMENIALMPCNPFNWRSSQGPASAGNRCPGRGDGS